MAEIITNFARFIKVNDLAIIQEISWVIKPEFSIICGGP